MKSSFVWYSSFYDTMIELESRDRELAYNYAKAVMEYGLTGEYDESNPIINALMAQTIFSIDRAEERWHKNKSDGGKGGRPEKFPAEEIWALQDQGFTKEEIMQKLGCSAKTYQRKAKKM